MPTFAEEKDRILDSLRLEAAAEAFDAAVEELEQRAFEERYALRETAAALGLSVQRAEGVTENNMAEVQGWALADNVDVIDSLSSTEGLEGENSPVISLSDGRAAVFRVAEYYAAEQLLLADVRQDIVYELKEESALSAIEADKIDALAQLQEGVAVSEVAIGLGKRWETQELISRRGITPRGTVNVPESVLTKAFSLPRPTEGGKSVGAATSPDGSALLW